MAETKKRKKPQFRSIREMADFFDHTDSRELDWEDTDLKFERPKMKHISIRIPEEDLLIIRKRAFELGIGHTALIRMILHKSVTGDKPKKKTGNNA